LVAATIQRHQRDSYQLTVDDALSVLGGDAQHGLSESEARARLVKYGKNEIATEEPAPAWRKFVAQFQHLLVILLLIATAISAALWLYEGESALPYEAVAIFAVVLLNAVMGYRSHGLSKPWRHCARCQRRTLTSFGTARGKASRRLRLYQATSSLSKKVTEFPPTPD
jgi:hypothetical protein